MVEPSILWNYGKLYIRKSQLIFPSDKRKYSKLTWSITVKHVQSTNSVRGPMLSLPKWILVQSLLYKTTTCLTRPSTIFLSPKWKKAYLKQPLTNFIQQRNARQTQGTMHKNKRLFIFTLLLLFNAKFNVHKQLDNL